MFKVAAQPRDVTLRRGAEQLAGPWTERRLNVHDVQTLKSMSR
jgi:hypothetical protein